MNKEKERELCFGDFKTKCRALSEYICNGEPCLYKKCPFYKSVEEANNERMKYFDKEVAYRKKMNVL